MLLLNNLVWLVFCFVYHSVLFNELYSDSSVPFSTNDFALAMWIGGAFFIWLWSQLILQFYSGYQKWRLSGFDKWLIRHFGFWLFLFISPYLASLPALPVLFGFQKIGLFVGDYIMPPIFGLLDWTFN